MKMGENFMYYTLTSEVNVVGWVGVTVDTFSENGTVLSYKLTEDNHIGDGNIWEFCLTDAYFNKFHSASQSIEK